MTKAERKRLRLEFRAKVFARDHHTCRRCGQPAVDPHHIVDRHLMPGGGYVPENGISLCPDCHSRAEEFHRTGIPSPGFSQDDLFAKIGSSYEEALRAIQATNPG